MRRWDPAAKRFTTPDDPAVVALDAEAQRKRDEVHAESCRVWQAAAESIRRTYRERDALEQERHVRAWMRDTGRPREEY